MRISRIFNLGVSQHELDFIDIDPSRDTRLFLDPHFLAHREDRFSLEATATIRSFFGKFLELVREGELDLARNLFSYLHEPNETCLGMSKGQPNGNAVGEKLADLIYGSLTDSKAISTGLIENIEDVRLFVPGVNKDKISDILTNIIRLQLIQYTRSQCEIWGMPVTPGLDYGFYWDRSREDWRSAESHGLLHKGKKLLLVPKGVVSYSRVYGADRLHRYGVLPFLQNRHLHMNSLLVQRRTTKAGKERVWVTKESIVESGEAPPDKGFLADFIQKHRTLLEKFKVGEAKYAGKSLPAYDFDSRSDIRTVASALADKLAAIPKGQEAADAYHKCVAGVLEIIFYPSLICPALEVKVNNGRKRVDITFENAAVDGFFKRLHFSQGIPCPYIFVECKNYSTDPRNPELDQLYGRLTPNRGKVGLLLCREVSDLELLLNRCRDYFRDNGNLLIPLFDSDLISMLHGVGEAKAEPYEKLLTERARQIRLG